MGCVLVLVGIAGCTSLQPSQHDLAWQDTWGDRGLAVARRDMQACVDAVESRRSLVAACMERRGWRSPQP